MARFDQREDAMRVETLKATAEKLVAHCRAGTEAEGLAELYDPDCVSVEAMPMPGSDSAEARGIEAIRGKHAWWNDNFEVTGGRIEGPFVHGDDRFAVIFAMETRNKSSGEQNSMQEVAIYTVNDAGRITREEFFY
jgi:ketosteroid isomerase-like protein